MRGSGCVSTAIHRSQHHGGYGGSFLCLQHSGSRQYQGSERYVFDQEREPKACHITETKGGMMMNIGDYLHFRVGADWDLYYRILGFNAKSIRIAAPLSERPDEATIIHRIARTNNFSSGTPILTINGDLYPVRIQRQKEQ